MSVETLKIVIEAENKKALAALKETAAAGDSMGRKLGEASKNAGNFSISLQDLNTRLSLLKERLMQATNPALIQRIDGQIRATTKQIQIQEAAYAKLGVTSLQAANGTTNALSKSFGTLTRIAYLVPGLGIAGIFNLGFEAIGKAAGALGLFGEKEDKAAQSAANLNKELMQQRENAEAEVVHLKALVSVAENGSVSNKKRLQAVKELRSEYPAYFKDLTNEQILTGNISKATDLLTAAIYKRAEARAREADIAKKATQVFENQNRIDTLNAELEKSKLKGRPLGNAINNSRSAVFGGGAAAPDNESLNYNKLLAEREKLLTENSSLQLQIAGSQLKVNQITAETITLDEKEITTKKEKVSELQKILGTLNKELTKISTLEDAGERNYEDSKVDRVKAYNKAIEELASIGLTKASAKFKELLAARDAFFKSSGTPGSREKGSLVFLPAEAQTGQQTTQAIGGNDAAKDAADIAKAINKKTREQNLYNESLRDTEKIMGVLGPEIDSIFNDLLRGESIGAALSNVFRDLALQIAKAAIKAAIFQAILSTFTGGTSSALGAVSGGGGFFGSFKKLLGFADGGIASGPKSGYPVMLHGTEAIFNGTQLRNLVNNVSTSSRMNSASLGNNSTSELASQISSLKNSMANNSSPQFQIVPFMKGPDLQLIINRSFQQNLRYY